ncbi:hypothetical protein SAMN05216294_0266 [Flagellimonas zhangzhouensis]|uniref:Uncharacterized protein n=1 Tax=Flagellimonas zhangzhouensis TaxID=1073328 RepID=A0A1H2VD38_9FLAO|nr:hypothetical protein SAMN05216294_0266 [Allomuricauda zhangzhouensis]SDW66261.1 hypothetical protein SAMN04487892_2027 [Allomuricauda zhangzhouensis]
MLLKIVLFFNVISVAMAIYMLISYLKEKKNKNNENRSDDAI